MRALVGMEDRRQTGYFNRFVQDGREVTFNLPTVIKEVNHG